MTEVSIIMPSFNSERYIGDSIQSVIDQSFTNWELLICDDYSKDRSVSIISNFVNNDKRIKLIINKGEKGAAIARNLCLKEARGRFISFLDSDDIWLPHKLMKQIQYMKSNKIYFCFSDYICIDENSNYLSYLRAPKKIKFSTMLYSNFIGCLTAIYDSDFFGKIYQPNITKRNDYALWLEMFRRFPNVYAYSLPESLAKYRINSYGLSSDKLDSLIFYWICIRIYAKKSFLKTLLLVPLYLMIIFTKKKCLVIYNGFMKLSHK